jgi:predicted DNA-binding protein
MIFVNCNYIYPKNKPMKQLLTLIILACTGISLHAQDFDTPVKYMDYISTQRENISKKFMAYASASAHGKRARKVENLRLKLLDEVQEARMNIGSMPSFKGDKTYRDSAVSFMKLYYNILNEDYTKVLNIEEIAENSYDEMETLLLIRDGIDRKLEEGNSKIHGAEVEFAKNNKVTLVESTSELGEKLQQVHELDKYYNEVYLLFFKPYMQEKTLVEAVGKGNITSIEQTKNAMQNYAQAGLDKLKEMKSFQGDNSVLAACKFILQFYVKEASDMSAITDYYLANERFEKMKKDYEKKSEPTKADVEAYNKSVNEINKASNAYNQKIHDQNSQRNEQLDNWNKTVNEFFNEHTPRYK